MQESQVRSLGQEDSMEKGMATHFSILAWRVPWTDHGVTKSWTQRSIYHLDYYTMNKVKIIGLVKIDPKQ